MLATKFFKYHTKVFRYVPKSTSIRKFTDSGKIIVKDYRGLHPPNEPTPPIGAVDDKFFSVDTSGLKKSDHSHKPPKSQFEKYLSDTIRLRGPISVATFMREVLTNPKYGYYMQRDVFGSAGDFITSPEISQMFGELIGIWCVSTWMQMGKPAKIQLVELGPGRGTLMHDLLRAAKQFKEFYNAIEIHLVEMSPALRSMQAAKLHTNYKPGDTSAVIGSAKGETGPKVFWHHMFSELPKDNAPLLVVAQEFFDALPVHQFQKTSRGWLERLIDLDTDTNTTDLFKFVLSPGPTIASRALLKDYNEGKVGDLVEISPDSSVLAESIALRIESQGGAALIIDYGEDFPMPNTLRAIQNHQFKDIFHDIGNCDLSCFVDFSTLKQAIARFKEVKTYGSVLQKDFLLEMGIETRLNMLMKNATPKQKTDLESSYKRLTDPADMGQVFKVVSFAHQKIGVPAGFYSTQNKST